MRSRFWRAAVAILAVGVALSAGRVAAQDGDEVRTLMQGEDARTYVLHLPPGYDGSAAVPLVIALHGAGMSGSGMMLQNGFNTQADAHGMIVAYPDGVDGYWITFDADDMPAEADFRYYDDPQFILNLIDALSDEYNIDPARVYLLGYSNGGMLALRLRCAIGAQLAGTALVGASMSFAIAQECVTAEPSPVLIALGTNDSAFPWMGYAAPQPDGSLDATFSIAQTMTFLPLLNGCDLRAETVEVTAPDAPLRVIRDAYTDCTSGAPVVLYSLIGMAHDWPGYMPLLLDDGTPGTVADAIAQFFAGNVAAGD